MKKKNQFGSNILIQAKIRENQTQYGDRPSKVTFKVILLLILFELLEIIALVYLTTWPPYYDIFSYLFFLLRSLFMRSSILTGY